MAADPALKELFRAEVGEFLAQSAAWAGAAEAFDSAAGRLLRRRLLALRSAAAVVELPVLVDVAVQFEQWLKVALAAGEPMSAASAQMAVDALAGLRAALVGAEAPTAAQEPALLKLAQTLKQQRTAGERSGDPVPPSADEQRMLGLFRQEVEEHSSALARGLMLLESRPDNRSLVGPLLRAAHSIKGAARAVRLESGVRLAHELEDHLAALQRGDLSPEPERIEMLLHCSDQLGALARQLERLGEDGLDPISQRLLAALAEDRAQIGSVAVGVPAAGGAAAPRPASEPEEGPRSERQLRVQGEQISELLALAASGLSEARVARGFNTELHALRRHGHKLKDLVEDLHQALGAPGTADPVGGRFALLKHRLADLRRQLAGFSDRHAQYARRTEELQQRLYRGAMRVRMRPLKDALIGFPRMVRDLARRLHKRVRLSVVGDEVQADRDILQKLEAPLAHLLRNALDHGIEAPEERRASGKPEQAEIRIRAGHHAGMLRIEFADDGRGIDAQAIRQRLGQRGGDVHAAARMDTEALYDQLFQAGFSTADQVTEVSGRGVGLDVVRHEMHALGGSVRIASEPGMGTSFTLLVPISRAVVRTVAVEVAGERYGFPLARIERLLSVPLSELRAHADWQFIHLGARNLALLSLAALLELGQANVVGEDARAVMIDDRGRLFGFVVDRVLGEFDLAVRPIDARLGRVADISAAAVLPDGEPLLLLDVDDLLRSADRVERAAPQARSVADRERRSKRVLVVDDSVSVRELERQLLKGAGFDVELATDGMDGWQRVRDRPFDLVITDVDMPRMDGIELTRSIKQDPRLKAIPVVIVSYRDRAEDRLRGLEARADSYLTKSDFHDQRFLDIVQDLIGPAREGAA